MFTRWLEQLAAALDLAYIRDWLAQFSQALAQPLDEQFEQLLKELS